MESVYIGALVLLFIIILYKYSCIVQKKNDSFLAGIWSGDKEFLKQSELKDLQLFIAPTRDSGKLKAFLTMTDLNGDIVTAQVMWITNSVFSNRVHFIYNDATFEAIPPDATMHIDPNKGTMMIYSGGKLYGFLIKNNETSMIVNETYANTD